MADRLRHQQVAERLVQLDLSGMTLSGCISSIADVTWLITLSAYARPSWWVAKVSSTALAVLSCMLLCLRVHSVLRTTVVASIASISGMTA